MKTLLAILLVVISSDSLSQPVINRTFGTNTVNDPRLMASVNLYGPRYVDTIAANLSKGVDTCGALIYTYNQTTYWFRGCNPKRWIKLATSTELAGKVDTLYTVNDSTIGFTVGGNTRTMEIKGGQTPIPSLQQVAAAGNSSGVPLILDSARIRAIRVDSTLRIPKRRISDSVSISAEVGLLLLDTITNTIWYRDDEGWQSIASVANSAFPNRPGVRLGCVILRPSIAGTVVTWSAIVDTEHDSIGVAGISCSGTVNIALSPSPASKVHHITVTPDESLMSYVDVGASFQTTQALISFRRRMGIYNSIFQGNGTTYVSTGGMTLNYTPATGSLLFDWISTFTPAANGISIIYTGSNGYRLRKETSGFSGNDRRYTVIDDGGNPVTVNPTTLDFIEILAPDNFFASMNPCAAGAGSFEASIFTGFANLWVFFIVEYL